MSESTNQPVVHSEKGFDQTDVPSEQANQTPDVDTETVEKASAAAAVEAES